MSDAVRKAIIDIQDEIEGRYGKAHQPDGADMAISRALAACDEPCVWTNILGQAWDGTIEESMIPSCVDGSYPVDYGFTYCPHCGRKIKEADDDDA